MPSIYKLKYLTLAGFVALSLCGSTHAAESLVNLMNREARTVPAQRLANGITLTAARDSSYVVRSPQRISLTTGLIRITASFQQTPIVVTTPHANLTIRSADVIIFVSNGRTRAVKVSSGGTLTMNSTGQVVTATQANQELVSAPLQLASATTTREYAANDRLTPTNPTPTNPTPTNPTPTNPTPTNPTPTNPTPTNPVIPPTLTGAINTSSGIPYNSNLTVSPFTINSNTLDNANGDRNGSNQIATRYTGEGSQEGRNRGLTTNKIYTSSKDFEQVLTNTSQAPIPLQGFDSLSNETLKQPSYEFVYDADDRSTNLTIRYNDSFSDSDRVGENTRVFSAAAILDIKDSDFESINIESGEILSAGQNSLPQDIGNSLGNQFSNEADYQILTTGFSRDQVNDYSGREFPVITRIERESEIEGVIKTERGNFIMLEIDSLDPDAPNHSYIFATGDVIAEDQSLGEVSVDKLFISAGLNNYDQKGGSNNKVNNIRAFALAETANQPTDQLADSGLLVVNPPAPENPENVNRVPSRVLHADFNLSNTESGQTSTISTTIGQVEYLTTRSDGNGSAAESPDGANDVVLTANTLGSSQGGDQKLVSFESELQSTSAGGGANGGSGPGYADYFILENHDESLGLEGGREHVIGGGAEGSEDRRYANLRLASINGAGQTVSNGLLIRDKAPDSLNAGYTAGLVHTETGANTVSVGYLLSTDNPNSNLSMTKGSDSSLTGTLTFNDSNGGSRTLAMDQGTYVDDQRYATNYVTEHSSATLVSGGLVESGIDEEIAQNIDVPDYMEWGFFFGDTDPGEAGVSHAHLASWVAGAVPAAGDLPTSGSATYTGSALGNVLDGNNSYVASGTYQNTWDFGTRRGTAELNFDGGNYAGNTALQDSSSQFIGALAETNNLREAGLQGSFVENGSDATAGVMGQFYIQSTDGSDYRAAGTFAADKTD